MVAVAVQGTTLEVLEGRVVEITESGFRALVEIAPDDTHRFHRLFEHEGASWARGWGNEATDALRVMQALR